MEEAKAEHSPARFLGGSPWARFLHGSRLPGSFGFGSAHSLVRLAPRLVWVSFPNQGFLRVLYDVIVFCMISIDGFALIFNGVTRIWRGFVEGSMGRPDPTNFHGFGSDFISVRWISSDLVGFSHTRHQHLWTAVAKLPPAVQNPEINKSFNDFRKIS